MERGDPKADAIARYQAKIDGLIAKNGWAVQSVLADFPMFSYTIGLTLKSLPEIIVMGLPPDHAVGVLNIVARRLIAGEAKVNERLRDVLEGGNDPVLMEAVLSEERQEFVLGAILRYGDRVKALQLVLPDGNNRLPWDPEFDQRWKRTQVLLTTPEGRQH